MDVTHSHYATLVEIASAIRAGAITAVALTQHLLTRIERVDADLHSYRIVTADRALEQAARADAEMADGLYRGPLHGVPVAVKDVLDVAGIARSATSPGRDGRVANDDATAVTRLLDAGAVLLGKLQTTEGAWLEGGSGSTVPVNPWDREAWPGTSASGAGGAVAAGLCFAAIATDTGGSLRLPAASTGATGLKPTLGRVSRYGSFPLAESLDHVGPICRTAADVAIVLGVIAGRDWRDPTSLPAAVPDYQAVLGPSLVGLRIGVDDAYITTGVDVDVAHAVLSACDTLAGLGAEMQAVTVPPSGEMCSAWLAIAGVEAALVHADEFPLRSGDYGPLGRLLAHAQDITGIEVVLAQRARAAYVRALDAVFELVDLLVVPTQQWAQFTFADHDRLLESRGNLDDYVRFVLPYNMSGHPALVLPGGQTANGFPISFQLVSRSLAESLLFRAADAFQQVTNWHSRHPDV